MYLHNALLALLAEYDNVLSRQKVMRCQKSYTIWLKEWDANTTLFHRLAIIHRRRNLISRIHNLDGDYIFDLLGVKEVFFNYFKHRWIQSAKIGMIEYPFVQSKISLL